ncbi:hexose transporter [Lipomyces tetrasporus]|uniref:Hexose transporter n=1 Tax=Lipomyces tetrasporus TaxID=54092 RepID=A0AAD7VQI4_9ASCO|nr:hexose transporter [Lipomyces tetrasporus]KAJ8098153.1 hexose transporter [Lipomyces tetrasporus]
MNYLSVPELLRNLDEFKRQFGVVQADGTFIVPYGRRPQILVVAITSTVGVLLQQLATEWKLHLAGRAVNGGAIGIMFTISPLWIGETCRPELRGFFLCFFNTSIVLGQFAIVVIANGSSHIDGKWQWWLPVVSMYIFPLLLVALYPWFPESPYWLIRQNRYEQAKKSLRRMYGMGDEQFYDIEMKRWRGQRTTLCGLPLPLAEMECFRRKNLKRTITAIFAASGQQLIGATFVTGYATYFFELINIQNYFLASCILYAVMLLASGAVFILSETLGRRTLIVPSLFVLCLLLLIIGIMGCLPNQVTAGWVIVVLIYIWAIIYQISIGATGFVLASEVATLRLRGVTQALVTVSNAVWGLIMQFTIPYMINTDAGNLGGKTGFIFFGTGTITAVVAYFLFPETKGISFDRLDELYAAGVKPRHFKTLAYATDLNPGIRDCESGDNGATDLKSVHYAMEKGEK